ncbi:TPA: hypothetical protein ACGO2R_001218 [Streptococcus suis]
MVQTLICFGGFTLFLIGLCRTIFKDDKKD